MIRPRSVSQLCVNRHCCDRKSGRPYCEKDLQALLREIGRSNWLVSFLRQLHSRSDKRSRNVGDLPPTKCGHHANNEHLSKTMSSSLFIRPASYSQNPSKHSKENFLTEVLAYLINNDRVFRRLFVHHLIPDKRMQRRFEQASALPQQTIAKGIVDLTFPRLLHQCCGSWFLSKRVLFFIIVNQLQGCHIPNRAVRPLFVVFPPLRFNHELRFLQREKPVLVQALVPELAVEAFDNRILDRFARLNKVQVLAVPGCPRIQDRASEFGTVVWDQPQC